MTTPTEKEFLQEEFISYQLLGDADIPHEKKLKLPEEEDAYFRIDILWNYLCQVQKVDSIEVKFHRLIQVTKVVLVILHSNTTEEGVFKTPFRSSLLLDGTLLSIFTVKLGVDDPREKLASAARPNRPSFAFSDSFVPVTAHQSS